MRDMERMERAHRRNLEWEWKDEAEDMVKKLQVDLQDEVKDPSYLAPEGEKKRGRTSKSPRIHSNSEGQEEKKKKPKPSPKIKKGLPPTKLPSNNNL